VPIEYCEYSMDPPFKGVALNRRFNVDDHRQKVGAMSDMESQKEGRSLVFLRRPRRVHIYSPTNSR